MPTGPLRPCEISIGVGLVSSALGQAGTALGLVSTGVGLASTALGLVSTALGLVSTALGLVSTGLGLTGTALGLVSAEVGLASTALGQAGTALGLVSAGLSLASSALGPTGNALSLVSTGLSLAGRPLGLAGRVPGGGRHGGSRLPEDGLVEAPWFGVSIGVGERSRLLSRRRRRLTRDGQRLAPGTGPASAVNRADPVGPASAVTVTRASTRTVTRTGTGTGTEPIADTESVADSWQRGDGGIDGTDAVVPLEQRGELLGVLGSEAEHHPRLAPRLFE